MTHDVFTNGRSNIHKGSGDKAVAGAPDVCKTPIGSAVVPIPYPNISQSSTLKGGSKSVKINGYSACLENSIFESSSGDEAGRLGGIISGTTGKESRFISSSFNVRIEGQNVVRHLDMTTHNHANTMGTVYGSSAPPSTFKDDKALCEYCKKAEHPFAKKWGTNTGNSQTLRKNIIADIKDHRWYAGSGSLHAHHLICVEAMQDDDWSEIAHVFGYSINHENNGVILPYPMALACQLYVPLHRSNHKKGKAGTLSYPKKIERGIKGILDDALSGKYCDNPQEFIDELDDYSGKVLKKISKFTWVITADGKDYDKKGNGCAGVNSITTKPDKPCPCSRMHGIKKHEQQTLITQNKKTLEVGS